MVDAFIADNDEFQVIRNDKIAFDTNAPSVQMLPPSTEISVTRNIVFPDLVQAPAYRQNAQTIGGLTSTQCESWSGILPQEWGPDEPNVSPVFPSTAPIQRNLPQELIGTVPSGTTYIDVLIRLTRTTTPPTFLTISSPIMWAPNGQWIQLRGGSCPMEYFVPLVRHCDFVLDGTNVYLRRYQSVRANDFEMDETGGNAYNSWYTQYYGNYANANVLRAIPVVLLDIKGFSGTGNKLPSWGTSPTNSCSWSLLDYSSVYSADIRIRPGIYKPAT